MDKFLPAVFASLVVHAGIAAAMAGLSARRQVQQQIALQIAVIDKPAPPPPPAPEPPKVVPMKRTARAPKQELPPPKVIPPHVEAPPPPSQEAKNVSTAPVIVTGITLESTSQGGSFAVGVGNTLYGDPGRKAVDPSLVKPYKAERYAPSAQVTEMPSPLNRDSLNLRKYYPPQARKNEFEGDVVLRLLIDADGSVAKVDVITDPGEGLGAAAAQAVRELRFSSPRVNGVPCATTVPFTVHFTMD
jgi:TonB family protein